MLMLCPMPLKTSVRGVVAFGLLIICMDMLRPRSDSSLSDGFGLVCRNIEAQYVCVMGLIKCLAVAYQLAIYSTS